MSAPRRGTDWLTAWSALVPVYALAAFLHAILTLGAVIVWIAFVYYASRVLRGARLAEDPWRGRASPRPYLAAFAAIMFVHLGATASVLASRDPGSAALALVTLPLALGLGAWIVAVTAPPGVRDERALLSLGVGAEVVGATITPVYVLGEFPTAGAGPTLATGAGLALTFVSIAAFLLASRRSKRRAPVIARKVPRE